MWFDGYKDLIAMFSSPSCWRVVRLDEKRFFDPRPSEFYLAKELVVIGEASEATGFSIDWDAELGDPPPGLMQSAGGEDRAPASRE